MSSDWDPESKPVGQPVVGTTTVGMKQGKREMPERIKNETVAHVDVGDKPAVVAFGAGLTLNLGGYQMARCDVRIEYPCAPTRADVQATYEFCKSWVTERLQAEVDEIRSRHQ